MARRSANDGWRGRKKHVFMFYALEVIIALVLAGIYTMGFCQRVVVREDSMNPVLADGDTVLVDRLLVHFVRIRRGDLVAYRTSDRDSSIVHVKRVVGIPGDEVELRDGLLYVNGELDAELGATSQAAQGLIRDKVTLQGDEYFVVGDNLDVSQDSRFSDIGNIERRKIVGRVWFVTSPLRHIGFPR